MRQKDVSDRGPKVSSCYRVRDFLSGNKGSLDRDAAALAPDDILIEGRLLHQELRPGLVLHCSDAWETHAFTAESEIQAGLSCIFVLQGAVNVGFGDRRMAFCGGRDGRVEGTAMMSARADQFVRCTPAAQQLRHLVISASPEWLEQDGLHAMSDRNGLLQMFQDHLASKRWQLSARLTELIELTLAPTCYAPALHKLYLEGLAVGIVVETLAAWMTGGPAGGSGAMASPQDSVRLGRAKDFIAANLTAHLTVEIIAREAGFNASGLQRLFQASDGMTIFEFVRERRLERARSELCAGLCTVSEAAHTAGYAGATNFATAFRRRYGTAPRDIVGSRVQRE